MQVITRAHLHANVKSVEMLLKFVLTPHRCVLRSTEAHAALLVALSNNSGLSELDLTCCPLFTAANAPQPVVRLPALCTLQVGGSLLPSPPVSLQGVKLHPTR